MTRAIRRAALSAVALAAVIPAGCDPCFGTTACGDPRIDAEGTLIWHIDGAPAQGVRVEFRPDGPTSFPLDTLRAESDAAGRFRFSAPASGTGTVDGTIVFHPPEPYPHFVFGVAGIRIAPLRVSGDRQFLGSWGVGPLPGPPHISYVGELFYAATGERAEGIEVEFRRSGGIAVVPDTFVVV
jgi:hypothetical protein